MPRIRFDFGSFTLDAELLDTPIAIGFGRTPISKGGECRLASPCNIFAKALGDVKALKAVRAGSTIKVTQI